MTADVLTPLVEVASSLTTLVSKHTVSAVEKKIQAAKEVKDADQLRMTYDAILNEVLQEREEALRIAQVYKSELERVVISDEDISHLQATVRDVLNVIEKTQMGIDVESFRTLENLITVDTLKTMQLLGFNYKAAIGEPLTKICSKAILNLYKGGDTIDENK